jgi:phospholipase/carboxylesterase
LALSYLAIQPREAVSGKPPVLVILHGYGADEHDLLVLADSVPPRFLVISLRAPIDLPWGGYAWYHLGQSPTGFVPDEPSRVASEQLLLSELAQIIEREGGEATDVILSGFSQGGAMAYSLVGADTLPKTGIQLRGLLVMSGYIPREIVDNIRNKRFDGLPVMITHGELDDLITVEALTEAAAILESGGAIVTATRYPCGHGLLPETIEDIQRWMGRVTASERPVFL